MTVKYITVKGPDRLAREPFYMGIPQHDRTLSRREFYDLVAGRTGYRPTAVKAVFTGLSPFQKRAGEATPRRANEHTPLPVGRATADAPFVAGAKTPVPADTILRPRRQARRGRSTCHGARRAS